jgi:hypothetical protein
MDFQKLTEETRNSTEINNNALTELIKKIPIHFPDIYGIPAKKPNEFRNE